jgi:HK97 gp10 family phage protein
MGDFSDVARLLRTIATHPTEPEKRQAREDGLHVFLDAARSNLSTNGSNKTGKLSASLGVAEKGRDTTAAGPIKGRRHASVGHLVEFGTAPHYQPNRNGGTMHPGARPHPFMRPAFEMTKAQIVVRAGESLVRSIFKA